MSSDSLDLSVRALWGPSDDVIGSSHMGVAEWTPSTDETRDFFASTHGGAVGFPMVAVKGGDVDSLGEGNELWEFVPNDPKPCTTPRWEIMACIPGNQITKSALLV